MQYLYDLWVLDSGRGSHRYANAELQNFPDPDEIMRLLSETTDANVDARVEQIRTMVPR